MKDDGGDSSSDSGFGDSGFGDSNDDSVPGMPPLKEPTANTNMSLDGAGLKNDNTDF